ncbi:MAG: hypothetical protein WC140_01070 [Bacteroidales bacterium]
MNYYTPAHIYLSNDITLIIEVIIVLVLIIILIIMAINLSKIRKSLTTTDDSSTLLENIILGNKDAIDKELLSKFINIMKYRIEDTSYSIFDKEYNTRFKYLLAQYKRYDLDTSVITQKIDTLKKFKELYEQTYL